MEKSVVCGGQSVDSLGVVGIRVERNEEITAAKHFQYQRSSKNPVSAPFCFPVFAPRREISLNFSGDLHCEPSDTTLMVYRRSRAERLRAR